MPIVRLPPLPSALFRSHIRPSVFRVGDAVLPLAILLLFGVRGDTSTVLTAQENLPDAPSVTNAEMARALAEVTTVGWDLALAPDGSAVVYTVVRGSVEGNDHATEFLLQKLTPAGKLHGSPVVIERFRGQYSASVGADWSPDSRSVSYFTSQDARREKGGDAVPPMVAGARLVRYDVASGVSTPIPVRDIRVLQPAVAENGMPVERRRIDAIGRNYRWSPSGKYVAFVDFVTTTPGLNPRAGIVQPDEPTFGLSARRGLYVLDVQTGAVEQVSPDTLHVIEFDWAPDEHAFVVAATSGQGFWLDQKADLFIVERDGKYRPLVTQPGKDEHPSWSPDGKYVAFASLHGDKLTRYTGVPSVVSVESGEITDLTHGEDDTPVLSNPAVWAKDSRGFYFQSGHHMASKLMFADIRTSKLTALSPTECGFDTAYSFSSDMHRVAFKRASLAQPQEVYVQTLPNGRAEALTTVSANFPLTSLVQVEEVSWPTHDGKFTIHGMLLTPRSAWQKAATTESRPKAPLPTLAFLTGGPQMVFCTFGMDGYNGGMLGLAARGYAVLIPNTRGRDGFGKALRRAFRDSQSHLRLPAEDTMDGLDMLVRRGIADPNRLGIAGHSYGAHVTSYAITAMHRFRAAAIHEAVDVEQMQRWMTVPGSHAETYAEYLYGVRDPLDPATQKAMFDESAIFHMGNVTTPTLLQFGVKGNARQSGTMLFAALQRAKVPVEFVVYDSGHGVNLPAAKVDELTRLGAWFDYWLRDQPYPDVTRGRTYDAWRQSSVAKSRKAQVAADMK